MKKEYNIGDDKIEIFIVKGSHYAELKFFVNGSNKYTVSNGSFDELVDSIEYWETVFNEAFFRSSSYKTHHPENGELCLNKIKELGYN